MKLPDKSKMGPAAIRSNISYYEALVNKNLQERLILDAQLKYWKEQLDAKTTELREPKRS